MDPATAEQSVACNLPNEPGHWSLSIYATLEVTGNNGTVYVARNRDSGNIYSRQSLNGSFWPWVKLATATPPQEYDLPLAEGWTSQIRGSCRYAITQENVVVVTFKAVHSAATPASTDTMIATLPDGFRPTALVHSVCIRSDFVSSSIAVFCTETGGVWIHSSQEIPSGVGVAGEIIFVAAS